MINFKGSAKLLREIPSLKEILNKTLKLEKGHSSINKVMFTMEIGIIIK